jgi:long-chain acyl-CoA synthetase
MENIGQLLENSAREHGNRVALKMRSGLRLEKYTYGQLWEQAQRMTGQLQDRGMKKGDRVLLWAPNSPSWVIAYLGILLGGGVVVPLDVRSALDFAARVATRTEPVLALLSTAIAESAHDLSVPTVQVEDLTRLLFNGQQGFHRPQVRGQDLALIMYTSGTTGEPKGVMLTHRNLIANVEAALQMIPISPQTRALSLLPLSHMYEQLAGLLGPVRSGARVVYLPSRQPQILLRALRREAITAVALVPQALQLLMGRIEREVERQGRVSLWRLLHRLAPRLPTRARRFLFRSVHSQLGGHLQFFTCGGAFLDPALAQKWENLGIPILEAYGATEATALVTVGTLSHHRLGTVGRVPPGQEVAIASDGEILTRGDNVSSGYWRNPEATRQVHRDGWYHTGDLGYLDADGYLHFQGRKKNMIARADGMKVHPEDIENHLNLRPEIEEAVVVGLPTEDGGVEVHAVILAADREAVGKAIRETNGLLALHQQVRGFTVWPGEDLPRTHTLKVKRHEVLEVLLSERKVVEERPEAMPKQAEVNLRDLVAQAAGVTREEIHPESALGLDLGLDSLSIVELLCLIEEKMGISIDEGRLPPQATVGDLEAILEDVESAEILTPFARWPLCFPATAARRLLQRALLDPLMAFLCPTQARGLENLEGLSGPLLFSANHTSHLDTPVVLKVLPKRFRWRLAAAAAADYWFANPLVGNLTALLLNSYPMARYGNVRPSMEHTVDLIDRGWSVLIYPEGTRSLSGEMQPFKPGVGLLAVGLGVPVVPIHLRGVYAILPKGSGAPRRGPVEVTIGEPLRFPPGTDHTQAARQLEREISRLSALSEDSEAGGNNGLPVVRPGQRPVSSANQECSAN